MNTVIKFISDFIAYFNGKKTAIGAFLLTLAVVCQEFGIGILEIKWVYLPIIIKSLNWIGMFFGGTGLTHKMIKYEQPKAQ